MEINENIPNDFFKTPIWQAICFTMSHARSLINNVDSNIVENFHNIVAKFVGGGKRLNHSLRRGYGIRCKAAAISFNRQGPISAVYKSMTRRSPRGSMKLFEDRKIIQLNLKKIQI